MEIALTIVGLALVVVAVSAAATRFALSAPLTLVVVGLVASYVPVVPDVTLSSEMVLVGFLPPLLYAAAIRTSLVEFRQNKRLRRRSLERANAVWERLGSDNDPPSRQYARLRERMLQAERREVLEVRRDGRVDAGVLRHVLDALDVEETILDRAYAGGPRDRKTDVVAPAHVEGCEHLREHEDPPRPRTPQGCAECLRDGLDWVHLRLCMTCGHVGCCDSSTGRHASAHFQEQHHPVIRAFEPGEAWRWCFVDQRTG